ncbi:RRM motif-containing protein [Tubulinosema ratisbonensis]|uniref:RRM motif-containing protein n=1 Tax=Tubulinosema ratisbonensis TaxID=291195 RepID=A0A437AK53_9MICR|nr:RRM motif-containing protein [Tubulinosema ratisbonensis]
MQILEYKPNKSEIEKRLTIFKPLEDYPLPLQKEIPTFNKRKEEVVLKESKSTIYVTPTLLFNAPMQYTTVRIYNLPLDIVKQELEVNLFNWSKINYISLSFITQKGDVSRFKGFVFVNCKSEEEAIQFIKDVDGKLWDNYKIGAHLVKN